MKLKTKLFVTLLTVSLIPLILCALTMIYRNAKNVENIVQESILGVSVSQIDNIEHFLEQVKQDMEIMSNFSFLQQEVLAGSNHADSESASAKVHLEELLIERKNYQPYILSMFIVDKNLCVVAASEDYNMDDSGALGAVDPAYLTGEFAVGNVYTRQTRLGEKRAVLAYQGIYYEEDLIGFILEEIMTDYFAQYHRDNVFWENNVMQILDGNDGVVCLGGSGEKNADFLNLQELHERRVISQQRKPGYSTEGSIKYSIAGVKYITRYSKLDYTDWTIRVTANVDSYIHTETAYLTLFIALLVFGVLLMLVLNYYITKHTIQPIEQIREVLQKVQKNHDYSLRLEPGTDDEVGELQYEINHLLQCVMELQMNEKAEQKSLEKKVEKDPMTGIMNKKAIAASVEQMVGEIETRDGKIAVGFVDIDDFRDYNTKYGHAEGDHVIKFVANTLRETIPGSVGRNGGDEFVFSMETDGREIVTQTMERFMRKLETGVINEVTGERMSIPCSIGIVIERAGKTDYRKLIQAADEAMYQAKGNGKNTYYILVK